MMSRKMLKQLGVLGVSLGLLASPLAFAEQEPMPGDPVSDPAYPNDPGAPSDPMTGPDDPMADPGAPARPDMPSDDTGFGGGTEPMPSGEGAVPPSADPTQPTQPGVDDMPGAEDEWEVPGEQDQDSTW